MFGEKRLDVFLFFVQKQKKFVQKIMEILRLSLFVPASLLWNVGNYVYCCFSFLLLNCLFVKKGQYTVIADKELVTKLVKKLWLILLFSI